MKDDSPDFLIIGAMKSATTTLHEQLARQPGVFMSRPKEPNFFSDDDLFARGIDWYRGLFRDAPPGAIRGESSTHYTKLPTFPLTVGRLARTLSRVKLVYVMRHPIDRLVSHYVHDLTTGHITVGLDEAVDLHPPLVDYGRYAMQLQPYLRAFGPESVLPVFFRRLVTRPQDELERICRFLGYDGRPVWDHSLRPQNVGRERLAPSAVREALVRAPVLTTIRQTLVPRSWSESVKSLWRAGIDPPAPSPETVERLRAVFDDDLARLGGWLGVPLNCENFVKTSLGPPLTWDLVGREIAS